MKLKLVRNPDESYGKATIGEFYIDGVLFCHSLEDADRCLETAGCAAKVYGETCIPRGTYKVIMDWSQHFQANMPHVINVPCFDGIRIHVGNRPEDTEGCILLGMKIESKEFISHSQDAFNAFRARLLDGLNEGNVTLEIV